MKYFLIIIFHPSIDSLLYSLQRYCLREEAIWHGSLFDNRQGELLCTPLPIVWGAVRRTAVFIRSLCYFRPPSCEDNNILALSIAACEILLPLSIFAISSTRSSILRSVIVLVVPSAVSSFSTL